MGHQTGAVAEAGGRPHLVQRPPSARSMTLQRWHRALLRGIRHNQTRAVGQPVTVALNKTEAPGATQNIAACRASPTLSLTHLT